MDYPGKVIRKTPVTPTQASASGVWTLDDAIAATKTNTWPVAGVPNPISRSLRFNSADSAYLNRTFTTPTNNLIWTWSAWVKLSTFDNRYLFTTTAADINEAGYLYFIGGTLVYWDRRQAGNATVLQTTQVFRDPSAWYHIILATDRTQATDTNRVKIYVNGSQVTNFATTAYPTQNEASYFNSAITHYFTPASVYFNGYMTEVNFVDGQALTPSSFGMTDPQTGAWEPIKYTGTYGTNGFYLNFKDATSTTTLGYDYSGNNNNWTTNNFSVTAGAGNDSLTDVPTPWIAYNTTGDVGGVVRGNYATLNPLDEPSTYAAAGSSANGNLDFSVTNDAAMGATFSVSSGKWYWEMTVVSGHSSGSNTVWAAIASSTPSSVNKLPYQSGSGGRAYASNGSKYNENTTSSYGNTYTNNDVIGCALDLDNGKVYWSKNGTFQASGDPVAGTNAAFTGLTGTWLPVAASNAALTSFNFGQRPFAYTPPAGFLSLCTTNLPNPTIGTSTTTQAGKYFNTVLLSGNGSAGSVTGVGFQPDFIWAKNRTNAYNHELWDAIRGVNSTLFSNSTAAEDTTANRLVSFNSDGFSYGTSSNLYVNATNSVAWNWNAGGSNATNTSGTITSTVRANTTAGFSIVTYTGTGANATVGHGLGVAPAMYIVKRRTGGVGNWAVWHIGLSNTTTSYILLDSTAGQSTSTSLWGSTAATSTTIGIGTSITTNNSSDTYVAYCFAAVAGYSAFGSYTGNGSADGPFVYTGFRPRYLMLKRSNAASVTYGWQIYDAARSPYNQALLPGLWADTSAAEAADTYGIDLLSNGFKLRSSGVNQNGSGDTYIYAAFAEFPFKFANAR